MPEHQPARDDRYLHVIAAEIGDRVSFSQLIEASPPPSDQLVATMWHGHLHGMRLLGQELHDRAARLLADTFPH